MYYLTGSGTPKRVRKRVGVRPPPQTKSTQTRKECRPDWRFLLFNEVLGCTGRGVSNSLKLLNGWLWRPGSTRMPCLNAKSTITGVTYNDLTKDISMQLTAAKDKRSAEKDLTIFATKWLNDL